MLKRQRAYAVHAKHAGHERIQGIETIRSHLIVGGFVENYKIWGISL